MKKISITIGVILVIVILLVSLNQDDSKKSKEKDSLLISPQKEVSIVLVDKTELSNPGFIAVHEVINGQPGQILEISQYLDIGTHENVIIPLEEMRGSKTLDISGGFPITNEIVVVVYLDDGDEGFNPNIDSILQENGNVLAKYIETGESVPISAIVPGSQEKVNDAAITISYTDKGFAPKSVEINQGDTVEFVNQSRRLMWVASNNHPAHDILSTFDQFYTAGSGESWQYTFDQKGEWKYHDHVNASRKGTIIVR